MVPIRNGNSLVKTPHVFVPGGGCFFETEELAIKEGTSPNGVGLWIRTLEFEGHKYFQAGNVNQWD